MITTCRSYVLSNKDVKQLNKKEENSEHLEHECDSVDHVIRQLCAITFTAPEEAGIHLPSDQVVSSGF